MSIRFISFFFISFHFSSDYLLNRGHTNNAIRCWELFIGLETCNFELMSCWTAFFYTIKIFMYSSSNPAHFNEHFDNRSFNCVCLFNSYLFFSLFLLISIFDGFGYLHFAYGEKRFDLQMSIYWLLLCIIIGWIDENWLFAKCN